MAYGAFSDGPRVHYPRAQQANTVVNKERANYYGWMALLLFLGLVGAVFGAAASQLNQSPSPQQLIYVPPSVIYVQPAPVYAAPSFTISDIAPRRPTRGTFSDVLGSTPTRRTVLKAGNWFLRHRKSSVWGQSRKSACTLSCAQRTPGMFQCELTSASPLNNT